MGKKQSKQIKKDAPIDTKAGSRSYNRFEMQIT